MENAKNNIRLGHKRGKVFEVGTVFQKQDGHISEIFRGGLCLWGKFEDYWNHKSDTPLVFELKSILDQFFGQFRSLPVEWTIVAGEAPFHLGQTAAISDHGLPIGFLTAMSPEVLSAEKIRSNVVLAEFSLELQPAKTKKVFQAFSRFPTVERDLSVVLPPEINTDFLKKTITETSDKLLKDILLFDLYKMSDEKTSVGVRLTFQSQERTLTDSDVQKTMESVLAKLNQRSIHLRT